MYVQLLSRPLKELCPAATQKLFPVSTGCCNATYYKTQLEQELLTIPEHPRSSPVFSGVRVTRSLVLCVMYCISLFVPLYFFVWSLCCLSFFALRILVTLLVSSNCSSDTLRSFKYTGYHLFFIFCYC